MRLGLYRNETSINRIYLSALHFSVFPFFKGSESPLKRAYWYIAKASQAIGLIIVLVGILTGLSNPLGDAEFRAETRSAIIGVLVFGVGWLIEKKLAD